MSVSRSDAAPLPVSRWSGDISRQALALLPQPERGQIDATPFIFGRFQDSQTWQRFTRAVSHSSSGGDAPIEIQEHDWRTHTILYVAFDGATHLLQFHEWQPAERGIAELVFRAQLSRRVEGIDGPCSVLLILIDHTAVETLAFTYRTPAGAHVSLGKLVIANGGR